MNFPRWLCGLFLLVAVVVGQAGTLAQFRTAFGDIQVELYDQDKPATVQNFIRYVQSGLYTNNFSHRLVPGFVLQAGGFNVERGAGGTWSMAEVACYPPVTNEFNQGKFYSNVFGTIAMAKTNGPNSATSQYFFNLADNSASLDNTNNSGGFTVFGHVIAGTNVLGMFNNFKCSNYSYPLPVVPQPTNLVLNGYYDPPFNTLPVLAPALTADNTLASISDSDLVSIDISLSSVQINIQIAAQTNDTCEISWNSAAGMTNHVEFATNLPPVWQWLFTTNGNGGVMKTTDATTNKPARFYRIRAVN